MIKEVEVLVVVEEDKTKEEEVVIEIDLTEMVEEEEDQMMEKLENALNFRKTAFVSLVKNADLNTAIKEETKVVDVNSEEVKDVVLVEEEVMEEEMEEAVVAEIQVAVEILVDQDILLLLQDNQCNWKLIILDLRL